MKKKTDNFYLNREKRCAVVEGKQVALTETEYSVMDCLNSRRGEKMSFCEIEDGVWGYLYDDNMILRVYITKIRKKLGDNSEFPSIIKTYKGYGYGII